MSNRRWTAAQRAAWVDALRSGEWTQIRDRLFGDNDGEACALGVGWHALGFARTSPRGPLFTKATAYAPDELFASCSDVAREVGRMNDAGSDFLQIADWLEKQPVPGEEEPCATQQP